MEVTVDIEATPAPAPENKAQVILAKVKAKLVEAWAFAVDQVGKQPQRALITFIAAVVGLLIFK